MRSAKAGRVRRYPLPPMPARARRGCRDKIETARDPRHALPAPAALPAAPSGGC
ncbi:MAG: hypothetical protein M0C28_32850 [Candidatus Moduliflexus flocculans]|nr:hypothetical protein [Candidatus Moduliflexus flocculans]